MNQNQHANPDAPANRSSTLAVAWLVVGLPLLWGVTMTAIKAAALFR